MDQKPLEVFRQKIVCAHRWNCFPLNSIPVPLLHSEQCCGRQNHFCIPLPKLVPRVDSTVIYYRGRVNTTGRCHNWHTNIPTMMSHFSLQQHWIGGQTYLTPGSLYGRGWPRPPLKGFSRINKVKKKKYFYCLYVDDNNRLPAFNNDSQKGIHCCRQAVIVYELS